MARSRKQQSVPATVDPELAAATGIKAETPEEKEGKAPQRQQVVNQVIAGMNGATSLEALAQEVDRRVVEGGGEANPRSSRNRVLRALESLAAVGVVKLTRPTDVLVERLKK